MYVWFVCMLVCKLSMLCQIIYVCMYVFVCVSVMSVCSHDVPLYACNEWLYVRLPLVCTYAMVGYFYVCMYFLKVGVYVCYAKSVYYVMSEYVMYVCNVR